MNVLIITTNEVENNFDAQVEKSFGKIAGIKTTTFNCLNTFFAKKILRPFYHLFGKLCPKSSNRAHNSLYKKNIPPIYLRWLSACAQRNIEDFLIGNNCDIVICSNIVAALAMEEISKIGTFRKIVFYVTPNYYVPPFLVKLSHLSHISLCSTSLRDMAQPNIIKNLTVISPPTLKIKSTASKLACKKQLKLTDVPTILLSLGNRLNKYTKKLIKNLCFSDETFNIIVHTNNLKLQYFIEDNNIVLNNKRLIFVSNDKDFAQSLTASEIIICDLSPYSLHNALRYNLPIITIKHLPWQKRRVYDYLKDRIVISKIEKSHLAYRLIERYLINYDKLMIAKKSHSNIPQFEQIDKVLTGLYLKDTAAPSAKKASATATKNTSATATKPTATNLRVAKNIAPPTQKQKEKKEKATAKKR